MLVLELRRRADCGGVSWAIGIDSVIITDYGILPT